MKIIGTFFLLALLPIWAFSQTRFTVEVKGFESDYLLVEKPFNGNYFPSNPEKILIDKKDRFIIESTDDQPGFLKINFGSGNTVRVFVEKGNDGSLKVDVDKFEESLSFGGASASQNQFIHDLQRSPLLPVGSNLLSARSGGEDEKNPKEFYLDIIDNIEAEKSLLYKRGKKKFSEAFVEAMEQDITYYYISLFSEMVANEYRAKTQNQPSQFTSKWAFYWSKVFEIYPVKQPKNVYSEYYLTALDYYLGDYRLGYKGDAIYQDPDLVIGEQFLEYDRLLWEIFNGKHLEYTVAALFSKRALLGNKEPILYDLFVKFKNDFPTSPFLKSFEMAVQPIGESMKKETFLFPEGMVELGVEKEINSMDDLMNLFHGKVVYIDIWATWCSPCLFEFRQKKPLEEFIEGKDIALVFLSVDNDDRKEKWQKTIVDNHLKGYHLMANFTLRDELIDKYGDGSNLELPRYMIFDKNGKLADATAKQPSQNSILFRDLMRYID